MKCLANIFAKFSPCEDNRVYSTSFTCRVLNATSNSFREEQQVMIEKAKKICINEVGSFEFYIQITVLKPFDSYSFVGKKIQVNTYLAKTIC